MSYDFGYGADMSRMNFKQGAAEYIIENLASPRLRKEFEQFCEDCKDECEVFPSTGEDFGMLEQADSFAAEYEDYYCNTGIEALLVACINDNECGGEEVFFYEDYCIYVPARIPEDDKAKEKMLTQERIREILAKYLNPIITDDSIVVESVETHD